MKNNPETPGFLGQWPFFGQALMQEYLPPIAIIDASGQIYYLNDKALKVLKPKPQGNDNSIFSLISEASSLQIQQTLSNNNIPADILGGISIRHFPAPYKDVFYTLELRPTETNSFSPNSDSLNSNQSLYRTLANNLQVGILFLNKKTAHPDFWNNKILELFDCSEEQLRHSTLITLSPESQYKNERSLVLHQKQLAQLEKGERIIVEWRLKRFDGQIIDSKITLIPQEDINICIIRDITQQKNILREMEAKNNFLETMATALPETILVTEANAENLIFHNLKPGFLGYKKSEILHFEEKGIESIFHDKDYNQFVLNTKKQLKEQDDQIEQVFRLKDKSGEWRWFNGISLLISQPTGPLLLTRCVDITEQRKAEQQAVAEEVKYKAIFEFSHDGILLTTNELSGSIDCNFRMLELFGVSSKRDILKRNMLYYSPENQADDTSSEEKLAKIKTRLSKLKGSSRFEWLYKRKDGTTFQAEVIAKPIFLRGSRLWLNIIRDISQRKEQEQLIQESEAKYKSIFESTTDGIVLSDVETGKRLDCNKQMVQMFGASQEEIFGMSVTDFSPKYQADGTESSAKLDQLFDGLDTLEGPLHYEWRYRRKSGETFDTEVVISKISVDGRDQWLSVVRDISDRKRQEALAQAHARKFKAIFNNTFQFLGLLDKEGKYLEINNTAVQHSGLSPADVEGKFFTELLWWHVKPNTLEKIKRAIHRAASGSFIRLDVDTQSADGTNRTFDFSIKPIFDEAGEVIMLLPEGHDITELIETSNALMESEEKYRTLFSTALDSYFIMDKFTFVDFNDRAMEMFECTKSELIGNQPFQFFPTFQPDGSNSKKMATQYFEKALAGTPVSYNWKYITKEGRPFDAEVSLTSFEASGNTYLQAIVRDISERMETERVLNQSRKLYRAIASHIPNGSVVVFDQDLKFILAEGPLLEKQGLSKSEIESGTAYDTLSNGYDWERFRPYFQNALKGEAAVLEIPEKNFVYSIYITPLTNEEGEIYAGLCVTLDIAQLVETRNLLEHKVDELNSKNSELQRYIDSNLELEQFAYVASHDLRAPLRNISSFSQLLGRRYKDKLDENGLEYLQYIINYTKQMESFINDLLTYSRANSPNAPFVEVPCLDILNTALSNLDTNIREASARVIVQDYPESIRVNKLKMIQLFQNLIANAIKFKKDDVEPVVVISHKDADTHWQFTFQDNGIGIDEQYHKQIFLVNKRLHTREKYDGSGIGLALCKRIIEQHGGTIWVESVEGEGSTFTFTLKK